MLSVPLFVEELPGAAVPDSVTRSSPYKNRSFSFAPYNTPSPYELLDYPRGDDMDRSPFKAGGRVHLTWALR